MSCSVAWTSETLSDRLCNDSLCNTLSMNSHIVNSCMWFVILDVGFCNLHNHSPVLHILSLSLRSIVSCIAQYLTIACLCIIVRGLCMICRSFVWSVAALYCLLRLCVVFRGFMFECSCCVVLCSMDFRNPLGSCVQ